MPTIGVAIALDRFTTFGDLLKYLRRRAGLTQRELSIAVGYSDAQICRLEQNERLPDLATLTARFLPVLHLEDQPEVAERLLELAATVRREDAPAVGLPPYKGLHYFDEADAELFFGRETLTTLLVERLAQQLASGQRFLAIIGASGSGKSSVVRAGLIPALHWQQPSTGWPVFVMTPTAHPLEALAATLNQETRQSLPVRKLLDELSSIPGALQESLNRAAQTAGAAHAILIVDQFEELFTICWSETEQSAFVENLVTAAFQPDGAAFVVIVLRADFYAHCARFNLLRQAISQHQEYIGPMTNDELRRAIEEPARRGHWQFEPGLVELLLHDVGADVGHIPEPGALPLLSHALLATWQRRRGWTMTLSGYAASGGVRGAIAETAEAVFYDQLDPEQRDVARQIFLRLTELGSETSTADTRRRVRLDELVSKPEDRELVQEVLLTLADARLITTDQETAEVAHEALIREWPTLRGWLEEDREGLRLHRRLTEAAQEWHALGRDPEALYRGGRLAQASEWAEVHLDDVNLLERAFLEASQELLERENVEREARRQRELLAAQQLAETERARAEEESRSNRRLRRRAIFLAIALTLAGVLAVTAIVFRQRASQAERLATSRELAAAAANNLQVDPERSLLLALHALDQANTLEARNALRQTLPELHILRTIAAADGGVPDIAFSPDGERLASMSEDGTVKIWQASSGQLLHTLAGDSPEIGSNVAFSPDGQTLATSWITKVTLWDVISGRQLFTLSGQGVGTTIGYNLGVGQMAFSPDGTKLAVANMDGLPKVWELAAQTEYLSLKAVTQPAKAIAYSADGRLLATGGDEGRVTVWDAERGTELRSLSLGGVIHSVAFGPSGVRLAAASEEGRVKLWDAATGQELLSLPVMSGMYDIASLADGNLVTAGQDGVIRVWDANSGQELLSLAGHASTVIGVAGSPDGKWIASSGYDGTVRLWDAAPGGELLTIPAHQATAWTAAYSPDGSRLASASVDGTTSVWESDSGRLLLTLSRGDSPTDGFTALAFSPDGTKLVTGSIDGVITLWDSQTGADLLAMPGHINMVVGFAFSPDGARLASTSWDSTAKVWDLASGEEITTFRGHPVPALVTGVAFSLDGLYVFTGGDDDYVRQWDAATGQEVGRFSGDGKDIYGVALHPDGNLLAMGHQDGTITLWDLEAGAQLDKLSGHAGLINQLTFNPDGSLLASAAFDRLAKVWDVASGEELFSAYGNSSNVFGVSFNPDSTRLATAGADGTVRTYTIDLDELAALAHSHLTRDLTGEECQKFLHVDRCPELASPLQPGQVIDKGVS